MTSCHRMIRRKKIAPPLMKAALNYSEAGYRVLPLISRGKKPLVAWKAEATTDLSQIRIWWKRWPDANIGIVTGDGLVVLDVDRDHGGFESLERLEAEYGPLPKTVTVETGGGGRHLYMSSTETIPNSAGRLGNGLDIRGDGGYIVAPPSLHASGKQYRFEKGKNLNETNLANLPARLSSCLTLKKRSSKKHKSRIQVPDNIPRGVRDDTLTSVAGKWRRHGMTERKIYRRLLRINRKRCLPPLKKGQVRKIAASIARYEPEDVPTHLSLDSVIKDLNKGHAMVMVGGKCLVLNEEKDPSSGHPKLTFSSEQDFVRRYANKTVFDGNKNIPVSRAWLKSPDRRQYEGIVFNPSETQPKFYNLWRGFPFEPKQGNWDLYQDHIRKNIADGEEEVSEHLIALMANMVQNPTQRPGVAPVLRGKQEIGKGVFISEFGKLFGPHFIHISNPRHLTGNFNSHLQGKLMAFADEAFWAGDKVAEGIVKSMITEDSLTIEHKGKDAFTINNYINLFFASNNDWVVPAALEERRFFVIDVGEQRMRDNKYFLALCEQMNNGGREALLYDLKRYDLTGIDLSSFPQTAALLDQKIRSFNPLDRFWFDKLSRGWIFSGDEGWPSEIVREDLVGEYVKEAKSIGQKRRSNETELGQYLEKNVPGLQRSRPFSRFRNKRVGVYKISPLHICREEFERKLGMKVNWDKCS